MCVVGLANVMAVTGATAEQAQDAMDHIWPEKLYPLFTFEKWGGGGWGWGWGLGAGPNSWPLLVLF